MQPAHRSRRVSSDVDRDRMREFFSANMEGQTGFPILSRGQDFSIGIPAVLRVVEDENHELIGAAYASGDPEDAARWRDRGEPDFASVVSAEILMIHKIAAQRGQRRQGVGASLVSAIVDDARAGGYSVLALTFDDRTPGLANFYLRTGFTLLEGGSPLRLLFEARPNMIAELPQTLRHYRWAHRSVGRRAAVAPE